MFHFFIRFSQLAVLGLWALFALGFVVPYPAPWDAVAHWGGIALFAAHLLEYLALRARLLKAAGEGSPVLLGTLVFGYGYWLPLLVKSASQPGGQA
ncbi:DUF1145 domain-containing protein [Aestuariirhabdus litorea]|uniref:DUF1145 domain-containing protein n=1 Tax=Aestuariirhabdus litorea TaxID=2528527 RepID=A0A3P3VKF7_9GAMM|nr:DUF1145 domain-containing protein [Aestuariirhabdus litorea]RRJ83221.1 DUF1145 domain-containing protein [Aestuariirhabdus litorea]RWW93378.1 DUF1145 domain-containing protein [Endozoicomonadaceae bacterium GTF-13]